VCGGGKQAWRQNKVQRKHTERARPAKNIYDTRRAPEFGACRQTGLHLSQGGCLTARTQGVTVYTLLVPCVSPYSISFHVSHFYELTRTADSTAIYVCVYILYICASRLHREQKGFAVRGQVYGPSSREACAIKLAEFKNLPADIALRHGKFMACAKKGIIVLVCGCVREIQMWA
jgi:hypothetical protein